VVVSINAYTAILGVRVIRLRTLKMLLDEALRRKWKIGTIGTGAMSDPYMPVELEYELMKQSLELIDKYRFRVHIATKSNNILRDILILEKIAKRYASVSVTITTVDDELARIIEPGAPLPSERLQAIGILAEIGVHVGILMMPQLPFIMETKEHLDAIIDAAVKCKARYIYSSFGVTLRDQQRDYYYEQLDKVEQFKHLSTKYKERFKDYYSAGCVNYKKMKGYFNTRCRELGISTEQFSYEKYYGNAQLNLFQDGDRFLT
jgi:DNA repair photolyase